MCLLGGLGGRSQGTKREALRREETSHFLRTRTQGDEAREAPAGPCGPAPRMQLRPRPQLQRLPSPVRLWPRGNPSSRDISTSCPVCADDCRTHPGLHVEALGGGGCGERPRRETHKEMTPGELWLQRRPEGPGVLGAGRQCPARAASCPLPWPCLVLPRERLVLLNHACIGDAPVSKTRGLAGSAVGGQVEWGPAATTESARSHSARPPKEDSSPFCAACLPRSHLIESHQTEAQGSQGRSDMTYSQKQHSPLLPAVCRP